MALFDTIRAGASGAADGYTIDRSLRFSGVSETRLNFTPSSDGNRKKWTWAAWIKRGSLDRRYFWSAYTSGPNVTSLQFHDNGALNFEDWLSGYRFHLRTAPGFKRDSSAWFHLVVYVDTAQSTASDRVKLYVNGVEPEFEATVYPSQNLDTKFNTGGLLHAIGTEGTNQRLWFDGYMADVYFLDGYAYDPSYFGETDATTGQWIPKAYDGSFGTNGYYLNFSDNSSTSALGTDSSGQGNNNTPVNFSVSAGEGNDSLLDTPTNNFCTLNPLDVYGDGVAEEVKNGNLDAKNTSGGSYATTRSTFYVTTGKWYWEVKVLAVGSVVLVGVAGKDYASGLGARRAYNSNNGNKYIGSGSSYGATFTTNDIIGIALDLDNGTITFYKNGASQGVAFTDMLTAMVHGGWTPIFNGYGNSEGAFNFGQRAFDYTQPTGYKKLNSTNLPDPTIKLPNKHFDTLLWSGNATTSDRSITGLNFQPDWAWTKTRNHGYHHVLFDAVRGPSNRLNSDQTFSENYTSGGNLASFDAPTSGNNDGGITWDYGTGNEWWNESGKDYVAWNWNAGGSTVTNNDGSITSQVRANATAGFSIVSFTDNYAAGSGAYGIGHGLGVKPAFYIVKLRNATSSWWVWHQEFSNQAQDFLQLNATNAKNNNNLIWGNTAPDSTKFYLTEGYINNVDDTAIAYCFSEVTGYSKFGSYIGNGNADGTFVYTGFSPAFIIFKNISIATNWEMYDTTRPYGKYNVALRPLYANLSNVEETHATLPALDILSNGFKLRSTWDEFNRSGDTFIYLAFAESPFKYARAR